MKIEQLKSGNYRVRLMEDGKRYSLTFNHHPSDKEIYAALAKKQNAPDAAQELDSGINLTQAVKNYIELKKDRNSPATLREYERLTNHFTKEFCSKDLSTITQLDVDREIAIWLKDKLAYKTMHNYIHMFQAVVNKYGNTVYNFDMLPEKPKKVEPYIPTSEDVKRILQYFKDNQTPAYVAFWLSMYGLRRGEICAIDPATDIDYETATIHVTKDMVEDVDHNWIIKPPKTQVSVRDVAISRDLSELIRITGKIYTGHPNSLNKALRRAQQALKINSFSWHKMRHYCCTELYEAGISENNILAYMGWSETSDVMRDVYRHFRLKSDKVKQREIADLISKKVV